jgi:Helix-turn-helix domain
LVRPAGSTAVLSWNGGAQLPSVAQKPQTRSASVKHDYAERSAAGPDFTGYHARSDFSEPHAHSIDGAGRRAILVAFDQARAWLWRNSRKPHGQAVSRAYREVLSALLAFAVKHGKVYPSHATLARLACCSERTVGRALAWLRMFGFLSWQRRLKRTTTRLGSVVRQTSNAYRIALQGLALLGRADGHKSRPSTARIGAYGLRNERRRLAGGTTYDLHTISRGECGQQDCSRSGARGEAVPARRRRRSRITVHERRRLAELLGDPARQPVDPCNTKGELNNCSPIRHG